MSARDERAAALDAAAAGVPGVLEVYAAAPDLLGRLRAVVEAGPQRPRSAVADGEPGAATVSVGVSTARPVAETAAEVARRARELEPDAEVVVRVSRVQQAPKQ